MNKILLLIITLGTVACGSNSQSEQIAQNEESRSSGTSCLTALVEGNEIEKMIMLDQVAELVGKTVDEIEIEDNKSSSAKHSTIGYNWKPEEERLMIMETKVPKADGSTSIIETKSPVKNKIIVGNIEVLEKNKKGPKEYFRYTYGPKTKEEKEALKKTIDKTKEESGKVDEGSSEMIKSMLDKENSSSVKGVGDMAFWSYQEYYGVGDIVLRVLHGNTMFKVTTDVSANPEQDLELAREVAKQIIANCN